MSEVKNLSKNIKKLIHLARISESELARLTNVSQPIINRLAQGITTNPNINTLRPIAKFFNITIEQLIGDKPLFRSNERLDAESLILASNCVEIPVLKWEVVGQWQGILKEKGNDEFLCFDTNLSEDAYSLQIEDSTMEPAFIKNTYIIVEPKIEPFDENFVIVLYGGQSKPVIRQIYYSGDEIFLKPINLSFDIARLTKKCKILGVVVQSYAILRR